jgi:hypothetical protein
MINEVPEFASLAHVAVPSVPAVPLPEVDRLAVPLLAAAQLRELIWTIIRLAVPAEPPPVAG